MTLRVKQIIPIIKCRVCGEKFQPKAITSMLCSPACRSKNKRDASYDRYEKMRKQRLERVKEVECKKCGKLFMQFTANRKYCSRECSIAYRRPKSKLTDERYGYKDNFILAEDKGIKIERTEVDSAIKSFLKKGGKIEVLKPEPEPNLPTVGSRDWDWEVTVGLDPLGAGEMVTPNYIVDDIISDIKNGG